MSGALWSIAQLLATRTLGFASIVVLARLLAPADFGVVAAIVVLLSFIELAGDAGMKATVVYEQERSTTKRVQTAFTIAVIASAALTVLGVAVAPLLAAFFGVPEHTSLFRLAALNILLVGLGNVQDGILLRDLAFRRRFAADALRAILRAAVAITLALAGFGAASLIWGMLAGTAVWVLVLFLMTRMRPTLRIDRRAVRSMGSYAAKSAALASLAAVTTRVDVVVIGRLLGERALGLYTIAFRVPELAIQAVAWQLSLVMFPALSRKRATDEAGLPAATVRLIRLQALYVLPVAAGLAVLAVPLVGVLFGPAWRDATQVLVPVTVLSAIYGVAFPLGDLLKATDRQGVLLALNVVSIPLLVLTMTALASRGLAAVAWGRVAVAALFGGALVIAACRLAAVSPRGVVRALGPGCVAMLGAVAGAGSVRLIWDDVSLPALGAAALAGAAGAATLVVLFARGAVEELLTVVPALAALKRRRTAPPVGRSRRRTIVRSRSELAAGALDVSGIGALLRRRRPWRGVLVVNYHRIAPVEHPPINKNLWSATPAGFEAQVRFLSQHCDVIGPEELEPRLGVRRPSVLITFDDGYHDCAEYALPVLRAHGIPATFFLTTGFLDRRATAWWDEIAWMVAHSPQRRLPADRWLGEEMVLEGARDEPITRLVDRYKSLPWDTRERFLEHLAVVTDSGRRPLADQDGDWLSWEDVRELASAGMAIGAHTVTHPILASLPSRLQCDEVGSSLDRLEHELGRRPSLFSYPVGMRDSFDAGSRAAVRDHGVRLAFSNYGGMARASRWDPLDVPRTNVWRGMSSRRFRALMTASPLFARW